MSAATSLKEETKDQKTTLTGSSNQSEESENQTDSDDSLQPESDNQSENTNSQESNSTEDYTQLLENIEKKLKECESELCLSEKLNFINIKLTNIKEVKKRSTLLEKDHSDINFLFRYIINLNKRKRKLTEK